MEQIMKKMMDMGMKQFMDKSREELSMSDATYMSDHEDEMELEQRYMELQLERNQRILVNDYIACMHTAYNRYADICYVAGMKDAVKMLSRLGLLAGL
ncbi:MAG: hypothetical protein K1W22_02300 [Lachnospiraceae bacterium]